GVRHLVGAARCAGLRHRRAAGAAQLARVVYRTFRRLARVARDQRRGEGARVEFAEILGLFTHADVADRNAELARDGDDDAALGRAVELGEREAGDADGLVKLGGLGESVLS